MVAGPHGQSGGPVALPVVEDGRKERALVPTPALRMVDHSVMDRTSR